MTMFEKELTVLGVNPAVELATGDQMWAVNLGEILDKTPAVMSRLAPQPAGSLQCGNKITASYLYFFVKPEKQLPYRIGSIWKFTVSEDGGISLVESKPNALYA
jgi:hypothetical protein